MSILYSGGPWPCPYCGQLVGSHQVHECRPLIPWPPSSPLPREWFPYTDTKTVAPQIGPLKITKPVEALRPEDV